VRALRIVIDSSAARAVDRIVVARWTWCMLARERFEARRLEMRPSIVGAWKEAAGETAGLGSEAVDDAISGLLGFT
jgi:hypothetical protein